MINAASWVTFSPISEEVKESYNVSEIRVQYCSFIYMAVYVFMNFPSNYVIEEKSLRLGMAMGTIFTMAGLLLRILIKQSFIFAMMGQTLCAIG